MSQAIVDPEHLEQFARNLRGFNSELSSRMSTLVAQFSALGDTWRDQEHQKFVAEFENATRVLQRFIQVADPHIPFLERKAARVREYLQQR